MNFCLDYIPPSQSICPHFSSEVAACLSIQNGLDLLGEGWMDATVSETQHKSNQPQLIIIFSILGNHFIHMKLLCVQFYVYNFMYNSNLHLVLLNV